MKETLVAERVATAGEFEAIDGEVAAQVEQAHDFAEKSPWPDPASATRHVFSEVSS